MTTNARTTTTTTRPHVRGRVKFGDTIRLYGYPGQFQVWATLGRYDFRVKPIRDEGPAPYDDTFPALDASVVEINGRPVPSLSCPIVPPASDYPHLPQFDYDDGPQQNALRCVDHWRRNA